MSADQESAPPPFVRLGGGAASPLVVAVPHAGRYYPPAIEQERAVAHATLEQIEDRYADRLVEPLVAGGASVIVATHARAWIDLNRDEGDEDSARARGGLGIVPSRLSGQALWRVVPSRSIIASRVAAIHRPYHRAIDEALAAARERHGFALLVDCHSMPPLQRGPRSGARIVIGDRHGSSAGAGIAAAAVRAAERLGVTTARNTPYAGAYTLAHHGRPHVGVHALQIEVDRSLYLGAGLREPSRDLAQTAALVAEIAWAALAAADPAIALAAE